MSIVVVTFKTLYPPYNAGETAGFDPETAAKLVARRIAEYRDPPVAEPVEAAPAATVVKPVEPEAKPAPRPRGRPSGSVTK